MSSSFAFRCKVTTFFRMLYRKPMENMKTGSNQKMLKIKRLDKMEHYALWKIFSWSMERLQKVSFFLVKILLGGEGKRIACLKELNQLFKPTKQVITSLVGGRLLSFCLFIFFAKTQNPIAHPLCAYLIYNRIINYNIYILLLCMRICVNLKKDKRRKDERRLIVLP